MEKCVKHCSAVKARSSGADDGQGPECDLLMKWLVEIIFSLQGGSCSILPKNGTHRKQRKHTGSSVFVISGLTFKQNYLKGIAT